MNENQGSHADPFRDRSLSRRALLQLTAAGLAIVSGCSKAAPISNEVDPKRLYNALEGIRNWLVEHNPEVAHSLQAGLTSNEVETLTANLPFALPIEVCLLYQWHNGTSSDGPFIFNHRFLSLQESVEFYRKNLEGGWQTSWFPLFLHKGDAYFVAPFGFKSKSLPIRHFSLQSKESPNAFSSLTVMMETALDWYSKGAVRVGKKGELTSDPERVRQIFERHNPGLVFPGPSGL